jgi:hypothetical protein
MSCHIDMQDGFAEFDSGVTAYNFLRYSDRAGALANSPFYFQIACEHRTSSRCSRMRASTSLSEPSVNRRMKNSHSCRRCRSRRAFAATHLMTSRSCGFQWWRSIRNDDANAAIVRRTRERATPADSAPTMPVAPRSWSHSRPALSASHGCAIRVRQRRPRRKPRRETLGAYLATVTAA